MCVCVPAVRPSRAPLPRPHALHVLLCPFPLLSGFSPSAVMCNNKTKIVLALINIIFLVRCSPPCFPTLAFMVVCVHLMQALGAAVLGLATWGINHIHAFEVCVSECVPLNLVCRLDVGVCFSVGVCRACCRATASARLRLRALSLSSYPRLASSASC